MPVRLLASTVLFISLFIATASAQTTADQRRVALVIGNGDYAHTTILPNAPNDGRAMAAKLRALDFEVLEGIDVDRRGTEDLIRRFSQSLQGADVGLFYYAGHGLQVDASNYIVPVDAALEDETDLVFEAVPLDVIVAQLERQPRINLVFMDSCRDNPLARTLARGMATTRSIAIGRGLARIDAGIGTLIAYATEPDKVALDGDGPNSPFTTALLDHIDTPGLEVRHMLTRVRQQVIADTGSRQVPWDHSSLTGDFFFNPPTRSPASQAVAAVRPEVDGAELIVWETVQSIAAPAQQIAALNVYLETYPEGRFARLAEIQIAALTPSRPRLTPAPPTSGAAPEIAQSEAPLQPVPPQSASSQTASSQRVPLLPVSTGPADIERLLGLGRDDRRIAQSALTLLGHDPGDIDGIFGANTRRALRDYQRESGRQATGYLTAEVVAALSSEADASRDSANSCQWAFDGECDEGRFIGHASESCAEGTDTLDCSGYVVRPAQSTPANSCPAYL